MIVCAAIKITNDLNDDESIMICGLRHGDCFKMIKHLEERWKRKRGVIQGFMNHKGEFLDRLEAYKHAIECGQINAHCVWAREDGMPEELYSEDLY